MYNDWLTIGNFTIHGYGVMIALGFVTALLVSYHRAKSNDMKPDAILDLALWCVIGGFVGAKGLYLIVEWKEFIADPIHFISGSGFVVYGGIITGILIGLGYCKVKKINFFEYLNLIVPQIAIAQGIGRFGCFFAGCCYGAQTDSFIGIVFPAGSIAPSGVKLWPTQLIMAFGDLLIAGVLLLLWKNTKLRKFTGESYMFLYGIGRFLIEFLRNDNRGTVGALSTSQFISVFIVALAVVLVLIRTFWAKKKA